MKKFAVVLVVLVAAGAAGWAAFGERLLLRAMKRQAVHTLSGEAFREMADGLNIVLCGSGSPLPDPNRAGPCVAVIAGARVMIVDVGSGSVRRLGPAGIPVGQVEDVFITHFHSDHIDGLGELMLQRWGAGSRVSPLPVHGPSGVEDVVAGFNQAYAQDFKYRIAHQGPKIMPPTGAGAVAVAFAQPPDGVGQVVYDRDGLKVTTFKVGHAPVDPAVGYRFDYQGRSAVISGDTARSLNVQKFATGADLLVHEALDPELVDVLTTSAEEAGAKNLAQITRDIRGYHTTPVQAAEIAQAAGVKALVFYHIVPALPVRLLERVFVRGVSDVYRGSVTVGRDGTWIQLPANSDAVKIGSRL